MGKYHQLRRRNVLKSIGAGSIASTIAVGVGSGADDSVQIVTGAQGDDPVVREMVSQEWLDHTEHVREM